MASEAIKFNEIMNLHSAAIPPGVFVDQKKIRSSKGSWDGEHVVNVA